MLKPNFNLTVNAIKDHTAEIVIEPLPQNLGHTLGNALRRVLLNSLPGGAAIQLKISGAPHQFSALDGMKEDVLQFILNLKELKFAIEGDEPVNIKLDVRGQAEVKAKDLEMPAGVTVADPEFVLAHLTDPKGKLVADITVAKGTGYVPADEHSTDEIGVIPLDAAFSPVKNVTYSVEATRVGRRTDYDKVRLVVTTDGTIKPEDAVTQAATVLTDFFQHVLSPTEPVALEQEEQKTAADGFIEDLDLPTRITNALKKAGIKRLSDLADTTIDDLRKVKNLGEKSADLIVEKAKKVGVNLK